MTGKEDIPHSAMERHEIAQSSLGKRTRIWIYVPCPALSFASQALPVSVRVEETAGHSQTMWKMRVRSCGLAFDELFNKSKYPLILTDQWLSVPADNEHINKEKTTNSPSDCAQIGYKCVQVLGSELHLYQEGAASQQLDRSHFGQ